MCITKLKSVVHLKKMVRTDLGQVLSIEKECFSEPWSKKVFRKNLESEQYSICRVAAIEERVVGYIVAWYIPEYFQDEGELHIHNIAVASSWRRNGIGLALMREVGFSIGDLSYRNCVISLEVRESNNGAQRFYKKLGFVVRGKRPKYYNTEGALVMEASLQDFIENTLD